MLTKRVIKTNDVSSFYVRGFLILPCFSEMYKGTINLSIFYGLNRNENSTRIPIDKGSSLYYFIYDLAVKARMEIKKVYIENVYS